MDPEGEPPADDPLWDAGLEELAWAEVLESPRSLLACDPASLTADGILDQLMELQQAQARLTAAEANAMIALTGNFDTRHEVTVTDPDGNREREVVIIDAMREEIAAALNRSTSAVHSQIVMGRLLAGPLAMTAHALAEGRISAAHARVLADQATRITGALTVIHDDPLDDTPASAAERKHFMEVCERLEQRALPWADHLPAGKFQSRVRRAVDSIDADGQVRRREQARHAIDVDVVPEDDGLALLLARMPIEQAARLKAAVDACADSLRQGSAAPIGQLRVQALLNALCGDGNAGTVGGDAKSSAVSAPSDPSTPSAPSTPCAAAATVTTEIQVVVDLATLVGLGEWAGTVSMGGRQPEPLSAASIRAMLADPDCPTTLRRLVCEPMSGHLLDRGRQSYEVSDAMRAFLMTRDQTCRHPGCSRAARRSQIDHAVAWDDGGGTDRDNLGPLCIRHHQLKTFGGWDLIRSEPDGTAEWRSPMGRAYTTRPSPLLEPG